MSDAESILVVDDNPVSRLVLVETLRDHGYEVAECDSGAACRRHLAGRRPNLILLDVNLPDASGLDLCREFKADAELNSVFIGLISTSQITPEQQSEGLNLGADAYITRPLPDHELLARVKALLRIQQAELGLRDANEELERKVAERTADLALANAALIAEIKERRAAEDAQKQLAQRLGALHCLDQAILQSTSTREIAQASLASLGRLLPGPRLEVWRVHGDTGEIVCLAGADDTSPQPIDEFTRTTLEQLAENPDVALNNERHPFALGEERIWPHIQMFSLRTSEQLLGALLVGFDVPPELDDDLLDAGREIAGTLAIALSQSQLFDEILAGRRRMRELSRRMLEVQEEERRFLSRELHDEIGQNLTGIKAMLEAGMKKSNAAGDDNLAKALALVNELMVQVRRLSIDLRPQMLDELGLAKAMAWHFNRLREQAGLEVEFQHNADDGTRLPADVEITLFRITQEALTNVVRHADTRFAQVRLWREPGRCRLQVRDEGEGFDPHRELHEFSTAGLSGMIERAELLGGELLVESAVGAGTCLTVDLPLT